MKRILIIFFNFCFFLISASVALPDTSEISAEYHDRKGDSYVKDEHYFLAIEEYRQAVNQGINRSVLFRKLAKVYYTLGFIDKAIVEMEKAVNLSPDTDVFRIELGVLYLAKDRLKKAKEEFYAALEINPGFTQVYYYLGELFFRERDYGMAWLSVKMAQRLGHKGQDLIRKLDTMSKELAVAPWNESGEDLYIRQILVDTYEKAEDIVKRISGGELFEALASDESMGPNANMGGFMGHFDPSELHPGIVGALLGREILAAPVIVETEKGFHIVQRITPFDFNMWKKLLSDYRESDKAKAVNVQTMTQEKEKTFVVYAGSFKKEKYAIKREMELRNHGYPSYRFFNKTKSLYNVVAGRYDSLQEAKKVSERISGQGYRNFIVHF